MLACAAMGQDIVGRWKLVPAKGTVRMSTQITFIKGGGGYMIMSRDAKQGTLSFSWKQTGDMLRLDPVKATMDGKPMPTKSAPPIVLKLKWQGKDKVLVTEITDGKPEGEIDKLIRLK